MKILSTKEILEHEKINSPEYQIYKIFLDTYEESRQEKEPQKKWERFGWVTALCYS